MTVSVFMALIVPATSVYVLGANVEPPLKQMKSMPTGGVIVCNDGLELDLDPVFSNHFLGVFA